MLCCVSRERRFASFAPVGDGCEVGGVGFNHEGAGWHVGCALLDDFGVLERCDAGERNKITRVDQSLCLLRGSGEAMKDGAKGSAMACHLGDGVIVALALVDDNVHFFGGQRK